MFVGRLLLDEDLARGFYPEVWQLFKRKQGLRPSIAMNNQPRTGHGQVESDCLIKTKHSDGDNSC